MKFLIVVSLTMFGLSAFAEDLGSMKQMANSKIDGELSALQKSRTCVQNATTVDAFKACKVDIGDMQKAEEKKDESMSDKMKDEYQETKEKVEDAM